MSEPTSSQANAIEQKRLTLQRILYPLLLGLVILGAWQGMVTSLELPPYLVPSPLLTLQTLIKDWLPLALALWVTLKITLLAFGLATLLGVLISFLFVQNKFIETTLFPYAVLLQVTPIVAIAPLIIIWVKNTTFSVLITCPQPFEGILSRGTNSFAMFTLLRSYSKSFASPALIAV